MHAQAGNRELAQILVDVFGGLGDPVHQTGLIDLQRAIRGELELRAVSPPDDIGVDWKSERDQQCAGKPPDCER